jgi:hypothetical protein
MRVQPSFQVAVRFATCSFASLVVERLVCQFGRRLRPRGVNAWAVNAVWRLRRIRGGGCDRPSPVGRAGAIRHREQNCFNRLSM